MTQYLPLLVATAALAATTPYFATGQALTVRGGGTPLTIKGGATLTVIGDVQNAAGTTLDGNSLGNLSLTGNLMNAGTLAFSAGAIRFNGNSNQTFSPGITRLGELEVANTGGRVALTQPLGIERVLRLTSGVLTTNNQPLTLLSTATRTAYAVHAGGNVSGNVTVQRYIGAPNAVSYRHLSSPVQAAPVSDLATVSFTPKVNAAYNPIPTPFIPAAAYPTIFGFDETRGGAVANFTLGYFSPTSLASILTPGRGWSVYIPGNQTPDFVGTLNTGTRTMSGLTRTGAFLGSTQKSGWHLLGNPYPQPIDWDLATIPGGMAAAISVWISTGGTGGTYQTRANGLGNLPDGVLAIGQGFFARITGAGPVNFSFTDAMRVENNTAAIGRPAPETRPALTLTLAQVGASADLTDETTLYIEPGATFGEDNLFDALRPGRNVGAPTLASVIGSAEAAINGLPEAVLTTGATIELVVELPSTGTYTLGVGQLQNFASTSVELLDRLTGTHYDLHQQSAITFKAVQAGEVRGRFALVFGQRPLGAANLEPQTAPLQVWPNPAHGTVRVTLPTGTTRLEVFDVTGRCVRFVNAADEVEITGLAPGLYTLRAGAAVQRLVVE